MKNINSYWLVTLLVCLFFGCFGVHRFINGHYLSGAIQLVLCFVCTPLCVIWQILDLILIALGGFTKGNGQPITIRG